MTSVIVIPSELDPNPELWKRLLDLAGKHPDGWTLIGAQMVALHGYEHGRVLPRLTTDADILVNARVVEQGTAEFARFLEENGFSLTGVSAQGVGHRFTDGAVMIDLLAPDGLDVGTSVETVPPARTVRVPGGTQALGRTELVRLRLGGREGSLPRPNLVGAILLKARAVRVGDLPEAQARDLAFLLSLAGNPEQLAAQLRRTERSWLRRVDQWLQPRASAWEVVPEEQRADARTAFEFLARS